MTSEGLFWTAIAALVVSIGGTVGAALLSRKFGLPGLAREVDRQQEELIQTLSTRATEDRHELAELKSELHETERKRADCEKEIGRVKADLRSVERELLDLYRRTSNHAPRRLTRKEQAES